MIVEIKFDHGESNLFAESSLQLSVHDLVLLESTKGICWGKVLKIFSEGANFEAEASVLRLATSEDQRKIAALKQQASQDKEVIRAAVYHQELEMKIVDVAYNLDQTQLFISFIAENRVDFRSLLKELAATFRTRIELRQIGARDAAKVIGGLGPCGRPLCCSEFIYEFPSVSIKMAKNQALSLKQNKLNGLCGRLMCCLTYEDDFYREAQQRFPDFGAWLSMSEGRGRVIGLNILQNKVKLKFDNCVKEFDLNEIEEFNG